MASKATYEAWLSNKENLAGLLKETDALAARLEELEHLTMENQARITLVTRKIDQHAHSSRSVDGTTATKDRLKHVATLRELSVVSMNLSKEHKAIEIALAKNAAALD